MDHDEYALGLERQALEFLAKPTLALDDVRELLILSLHSCRPAQTYFEQNCQQNVLLEQLFQTIEDRDGFNSGDARIGAANCLASFEPKLLLASLNRIEKIYFAENGEKPGGCLRELISRAIKSAESEV